LPELPEVETIVRELNESDLIGKKISSLEVFWERTIASPSVSEFCTRIMDQTIREISRRGKFIVITFNQDTLLIHLRMTGKLSFSKKPQQLSSHERLRLGIDDGRFLHYEDQRKFGKWYLLSNPEEKFSQLGIEPFSSEFTLKFFQTALNKSSLAIKVFLLNQRHVVGIGNIYADEALWEAKIYPLRKANSLNLNEVKNLFKAVKNVLELGIANQGTSLGSKMANYFSVNRKRGNYQTQLKVFRQDGIPCPRCGTTIIKIVAAQRGTHLCPHCQKATKE
jgi:formamidopyrimidine-DNA glycosylase